MGDGYPSSMAKLDMEIINNAIGGIQSKIWERANGGQIQVPDDLNNENCTVHPNIELSVLYFQSIRDLNLPPISALPFTTNLSGTIATLVLFIISMKQDTMNINW